MGGVRPAEVIALDAKLPNRGYESSRAVRCHQEACGAVPKNPSARSEPLPITLAIRSTLSGLRFTRFGPWDA
jgi:hypothetical protein